MAKKHYKAPLHQTGTVITTKTAYGSTSDMIADHSKYKITIEDSQVLCKDDKGFYVTSKSRIDTGLADPNRYANISSRFNHLEEVENTSRS